MLKKRRYNKIEIDIIIEQALECVNLQIKEGTSTERFIYAMGELQIYLRQLGVEDKE